MLFRSTQGEREERGQDVVVDDPDRLGKRPWGQARDHLGQVLGKQRLSGLSGLLGNCHGGSTAHATHGHAGAGAKEDGLVGLPALSG